MIPAKEITRAEFDELLAEYDSVLDSVASAKGGMSGLLCANPPHGLAWPGLGGPARAHAMPSDNVHELTGCRV